MGWQPIDALARELGCTVAHRLGRLTLCRSRGQETPLGCSQERPQVTRSNSQTLWLLFPAPVGLSRIKRYR